MTKSVSLLAVRVPWSASVCCAESVAAGPDILAILVAFSIGWDTVSLARDAQDLCGRVKDYLLGHAISGDGILELSGLRSAEFTESSKTVIRGVDVMDRQTIVYDISRARMWNEYARRRTGFHDSTVCDDGEVVVF